MIFANRLRTPAVATPEEARTRLRELISSGRDSIASLSRMLRRRDGHLAAFINEGTPRILAAADCKLIAAYFRVSAADLGGELKPVTEPE